MQFHIDQHTERCCSRQKETGRSMSFCEMNPQAFLFYVHEQFVLINYNLCIQGYDHLDFKQDLVKKVIGVNKLFDYYEVRRSCYAYKELENFRRQNLPLRKSIRQINYIYEDNARKKYAITTCANFIDSICNQEIIRENYLKAKECLIDRGYECMLKELDELYGANSQAMPNDIEICKTIDHIVKSIHTQIK